MLGYSCQAIPITVQRRGLEKWSITSYKLLLHGLVHCPIFSKTEYQPVLFFCFCFLFKASVRSRNVISTQVRIDFTICILFDNSSKRLIHQWNQTKYSEWEQQRHWDNYKEKMRFNHRKMEKGHEREHYIYCVCHCWIHPVLEPFLGYLVEQMLIA